MFSFKLPNGNKIDTDGVIDAMEDITGKTRYFLDTDSGNAGCVSMADKKSVTKLVDNSRYIEIPTVSASRQAESMTEFMNVILKSGSKKEKTLYARLKKTLRKDKPETFDNCLIIMRAYDESLLAAWATWQGDVLFENMKKWFASLPIKVEEKFAADCDCELCKLMENGEHTLGDFSEALQKEKRKKKGTSNLIELEQTESVDDLYCDAMDAMSSGESKMAIRLLTKALKIDPHYVQTHIGLSSVYRQIGDHEKYREHTIKGYEETRNNFKTWPKELSWYDMDNRKYHRAIFFRAGLHVEDGETEQGLSLYRQLLSMWPNDNQGVRYYAAAVYAGLPISKLDDLWDKCNEKQNWDVLEEMVQVQNKKHKFWREPRAE